VLRPRQAERNTGSCTWHAQYRQGLPPTARYAATAFPCAGAVEMRIGYSSTVIGHGSLQATEKYRRRHSSFYRRDKGGAPALKQADIFGKRGKHVEDALRALREGLSHSPVLAGATRMPRLGALSLRAACGGPISLMLACSPQRAEGNTTSGEAIGAAARPDSAANTTSGLSRAVANQQDSGPQQRRDYRGRAHAERAKQQPWCQALAHSDRAFSG